MVNISLTKNEIERLRDVLGRYIEKGGYPSNKLYNEDIKLLFKLEKHSSKFEY